MRRLRLLILWTTAIFLLAGSTQTNQAAALPPGVRLISCDRQSAVIEVTVPDLQLREIEVAEQTYSEFLLEGWINSTQPGKPTLPRGGFWLALPPGARATLITESVQSHLLSISRPLPGSHWETDPGGDHPAEVVTPDPDIYARSTIYPTQWADLGEATYVRTFWAVPVTLNPVRVQAASGQAEVATNLRIRVQFEGGRKGSAIADPYGDALAQSALINFHQAQSWRVRPQAPASTLAEGLGKYKLLVDRDGLYVVTYEDLEAAGADPGSIDPLTFQIHLAGEEIPIRVQDEFNGIFQPGDYLLFYGLEPRGTYTYNNYYNEKNIYWLDWGGAPGLRLTEKDAPPGAAPLATDFRASIRQEYDIIYDKFAEAPFDEPIDHWMWEMLDASQAPDVSSYLLDLPGLVLKTGQTYNLSISLRGGSYSRTVTTDDHHVTVKWNDYLAIDSYFTHQEQLIASHGVPHTAIRTTSPNELFFTAEVVNLSNPNFFYIDWFKVDYWRDFSVNDDTLLFHNPINMGPGFKNYELTGLQDEQIELWNLTRSERLTGFELTEGTLAFQDSSSDTTYYYVAGQSGWLTPEIVEDEPSNWQSSLNQADYLIISHSDFYDAIQPLADHYRSEGMEVITAKVEDVYDEFSYGLKDPQAIYDFIQYAYLNYQGNIPAFVLLVGDASWDYKNNDELPYVDYLPTHSFMTEKWGETSSDNWFVAFGGLSDPLPDVFIGRFPVNSEEEATILVNKSLGYADAPGGYWRSQVIFTNGAYQDTDAVHFDTTAQALIDTYFPEWYDPWRVYSTPSAGYQQYLGDSEELIGYINQGAAMVNYIGHAGNQMWETLDQSEISLLENSPRLPFAAAFSCFTGIFSNTVGFGEAFTLEPDGGGIAYWSNTALGYRTNNTIMNDCLFQTLFEQDSLRFGSITAGAKYAYYSIAGNTGNVIDIFTLLGDPVAAFVFDDPQPEDTLDTEPPVIEFIGLGENFNNWDFVENPIIVTCELYDNQEIILSSAQFDVHLTWLRDAEGFNIQQKWDWDWTLDSLALPDSSGGHLIQIAFQDSLPGGSWEFYAAAEDYLGNSTTETTKFRISSDYLSIEKPLYYNHPGSDETSFTFSLTSEATVTVKVYSVAGRLLWTCTEPAEAGYNIIRWDGKDHQGNPLSNGAYIYKISARNGDKLVEKTEKMAKLR